MSTFDTNEFLPKMSSNRCYVLIARIDLVKIMKLMLRVSSESKYSFFKRMVIQHIVENGCSRDQRKLNLFIQESWRASLIFFKTWDASRVFAASLLLKLALKFFRENRLLHDRLYKRGIIIWRNLLKRCSLFSSRWMSISCYLDFERRRNGNDIFFLQNLFCRNQIFLRSQRYFSGTEETLL